MRKKRIKKEVVKPLEVVELKGFSLKICQRFPSHGCFHKVENWTETREVKGKQEIVTRRAICPAGHPNEIVIINNLDYI